MTCTVETLLSAAEALADRLKADEMSTESLVVKSFSVSKRVSIMGRYREEVDKMNAALRRRPRQELIRGIQLENRQIRELQKENQELRCALDEHQNALEIIMTRYRLQMAVLANQSKFDLSVLKKGRASAIRARQSKIEEMALIMRYAIQLDDQLPNTNVARIVQLKKENASLRRLLDIGQQCADQLTIPDDTDTDSSMLTSPNYPTMERIQPLPSQEDPVMLRCDTPAPFLKPNFPPLEKPSEFQDQLLSLADANSVVFNNDENKALSEEVVLANGGDVNEDFGQFEKTVDMDSNKTANHMGAGSEPISSHLPNGKHLSNGIEIPQDLAEDSDASSTFTLTPCASDFEEDVAYSNAVLNPSLNFNSIQNNQI